MYFVWSLIHYCPLPFAEKKEISCMCNFFENYNRKPMVKNPIKNSIGPWVQKQSEVSLLK